MKRIITLMSFCLFAGMMFGQAPALKVDANSNVGIGIAAPVTKLHVVSSDLFVGTIDGTGPTSRLKVNHSGTNSGLLFATGGANRYSAAAYQAGSGAIDFTFYNDQNATASMLIDGDTNNTVFAGTVSSSGGLLTSDKRLKRNIKSYESGLDKIMRINPVTFQYKKSSLNKVTGDREFIGVLAQELAKIEPSVVSTYTHYEVDENLIPTGETKEFLQIQADAVQYMLVNAIKEQQELITDQSDRINRLEEMVENLITKSTTIQETIGSSDQSLLKQNVPNPFSSETSISYSLAKNVSTAEMVIYDMSGSLIKRINISDRGEGTLNLEASSLTSGTYTYSLIADGKIIKSNKMIRSN